MREGLVLPTHEPEHLTETRTHDPRVKRGCGFSFLGNNTPSKQQTLRHLHLCRVRSPNPIAQVMHAAIAIRLRNEGGDSMKTTKRSDANVPSSPLQSCNPTVRSIALRHDGLEEITAG